MAIHVEEAAFIPSYDLINAIGKEKSAVIWTDGYFI
jgi:hypothetical protein